MEIIKRGRAFARLVPAVESNPMRAKVDFAARRKAIWGNRVFSAAEVRALRDAEMEGEQG